MGPWGLLACLNDNLGRVPVRWMEPNHSLGSESVLGLGGPDLLVSAGLVELHELGEIELGLLEDLDLLDEHVLKREDLRALFSDLAGNLVAEAAIKY